MKETMKTLRKQRAVAQAALEAIDEKIKDKESQTLVRCDGFRVKGCGRAFEIRELEYVQTHWYEGPHGCTGGDHWHADEGQWFCPSCGAMNRLYDKPDIEALSHLFKGIRNVYDR